MPYRYPPEFRRKVLDLLAVGRSVGGAGAKLRIPRSQVCQRRALTR